MNYRLLANGALARRESLVAEAKRVHADTNLSDAEKRERVENLNAQIQSATAEARGYIEQGEREAEVRSLGGSALFAPAGERRDDGDGWASVLPSASEYRAALAEGSAANGGATVPQSVSSTVVDLLRGSSVFLQAPGLNVVPFVGGSFVLPQLTAWSDPSVTTEGATITQGTQTFNPLTFTPIKFADFRLASNELLADSAVGMRELIAAEMTRGMAHQIDTQAFGAGNGTTALKGLAAAGMATVTTLTTGNTQVKWDAVIDSYAAVIAGNGTPSVIWCSADQFKGLLKERTNAGGAGTGEYMQGSITGDPAKGALGLPILVSTNLPARTVIVADASRIFVGQRTGVEIAVSEHVAFSSDQVGFRITQRLAGLAVAEATSVQTVIASAT